ncbi:hypothetical protein EXIGLDRAFT_726960, partial [Exidia glandulosa HHB12029]
MVKARLWLLWSTVKELSFRLLSAPDQARKENCWHGVDCVKQTSSIHALRYNHVRLSRWPERSEQRPEERQKKREQGCKPADTSSPRQPQVRAGDTAS